MLNNKEYQKQYRNSVRKEVLEHYSHLKGTENPDGIEIKTPCCGCCQENDLSKLCIDHIKGNGVEHRKSLFGKSRSGFPFYCWLRRNNYPQGYQTLCRKHNRRKQVWDKETWYKYYSHN